MGFYYPDVDFGFKKKVHPRRADMEVDVENFLQSFNVPVTPKRRGQVAMTSFIAHCYPEQPYTEKLLILNRLIVTWFIIDDIRDEDEVNAETLAFHNEFVALHKDETRPQTHPLLRAMQDILLSIKAHSDPFWYEIFRDSNYQSSVWAHEGIYARRLTKPDFVTATICRVWDGYMLPINMFNEYLDDKYLTPKLRANAVYNTMLYLSVNIVVTFNNYIGFEKEEVKDNPYLPFYALQYEKSLSAQETINRLHRKVEKKFKKFMLLYNRLDDLFEGEELELMKYACKHFRQIHQGAKDYSLDCRHRYWIKED